jgi:hypothetical protein
MREDTAWPANPKTGYALEKLFSEKMCQAFNTEGRVPCSIARFHTLYGPGDDRPPGHEHVIEVYAVDQWGVVYKIDGRSGDAGRIIWRMDPGQEKLPLSNRGAALWGNLVISTANYPARAIATNGTCPNCGGQVELVHKRVDASDRKPTPRVIFVE